MQQNRLAIPTGLILQTINFLSTQSTHDFSFIFFCFPYSYSFQQLSFPSTKESYEYSELVSIGLRICNHVYGLHSYSTSMVFQGRAHAEPGDIWMEPGQSSWQLSVPP